MQPTAFQIKALLAMNAKNRKNLDKALGKENENLAKLTNVLYRYILGMDAPTYRKIHNLSDNGNVRKHLLENNGVFEYQTIVFAEREIVMRLSGKERVSFLVALKIFNDVGQSLIDLGRAA